MIKFDACFVDLVVACLVLNNVTVYIVNESINVSLKPHNRVAIIQIGMIFSKNKLHWKYVLWKLLDAACTVCAELWKAGDGERHGQTHDQRRAAGQQVRHTLISSFCLPSLSSLRSFGSSSSSVFTSHGVILSYQVSGHFSRQSRVDPASRHRVQRQLWVFICLSPFVLTVLVKRSITGNYWTLLVVFTMHWTDSADKTAWLTVACSKYLIADIW